MGREMASSPMPLGTLRAVRMAVQPDARLTLAERGREALDQVENEAVKEWRRGMTTGQEREKDVSIWPRTMMMMRRISSWVCGTVLPRPMSSATGNSVQSLSHAYKRHSHIHRIATITRVCTVAAAASTAAARVTPAAAAAACVAQTTKKTWTKKKTPFVAALSRDQQKIGRG